VRVRVRVRVNSSSSSESKFGRSGAPMVLGHREGGGVHPSVGDGAMAGAVGGHGA